MTGRLGVHLSQQLPIADVVRVARLAEDLGYERFFISDVLVRDPFVVLAACANATHRITLGTAVMPLYERHPLSAAVASASLAQLSNGRFCFGIGTSHQEIVEGRLGLEWRRPVAHLVEYIEAIRALHTGKHVDHVGQFYRFSGALSSPPDEPVPIYLGPSGPTLFERAGAIADGVVLNWGPPNFLADRLRLLDNGRSDAGRMVDDIEITCSLWCAVTQSAQETSRLRNEFRGRAAMFAQTAIYRRRFRELGFVDDMAAVETAIAAGRAVDPGISDDLIDAISIIGDVEYCRRRLDEYRPAGVMLPLVVPLTTASGYLRPIRQTLQALAP